MAKTRTNLTVVSTMQVKPSKLKLTEKFRGRTELVPMADREKLAHSIKEQGQQQAIQVRSIPGTDEFEVIFGNTRALALQMLEEGYQVANEKDKDGNPVWTFQPDPTILARVEVIDCDDATAIAHGIVENAQRINTSPIDNALNHVKLRELGLSDRKIAQMYGVDPAVITRTKKLLELPASVQERIHRGDMSYTAGVFLAEKCKDVTEAGAVEEIVSGIEAEAGLEYAIGMSQVVDAVKKWRKARTEAAKVETPPTGQSEAEFSPNAPGTDDSGAIPTESGGVALPPRTMKQIKDTLKSVYQSERTPERTGQLAMYLEQWINQEMETETFFGWVMECLSEELKPEPVPVSAEDSFDPAVNPRASDEAPTEAAEAPTEAPTEAPADATKAPRGRAKRVARKV